MHVRIIRTITVAVVGSSLVFGAAFLPGCGGGNIGTNVRKPASERPDVDRAVTAMGTLTIPADKPFNLTAFMSGQASSTSFLSGQVGAARGEAEAVGNDGAMCRAEARNDGSAWGEFQLGYCFDNTTGVPLDATVKLRFTTSESTTGRQGDAETQNATISSESTLTFFIKDTNGLVIKKEELLSSSLEKGHDSIGSTHDLVFDVRFGPNRGYYLMLAGRTDVESDAPHSIATSLSVSQYLLQIEWRGTTMIGDDAGDQAPAASASTPTTDPGLP